MPDGTITAHVLFGLEAYVARMGLDFAAFSRRVGLTDALLRDKANGFIPIELFVHILESGARETQDDSFGLQFGAFNQLYSIGLPSLLIARSSTVRDAIKLITSYSSLYSKAYSIDFVEGGETGRLSWIMPLELSLSPQFNDFTIAYCVEKIRRTFGIDWRPIEARLGHCPPRSKYEFLRMLGDNVIFNAGPTSVLIENEILSLEMPERDEQILKLYKNIADTILDANEDKDDKFVTQMMDAIESLLGEDNLSIETVARQCNVSVKTLQRRLSKQSITFRNLVTRVQHNVTTQLLLHSNLSVSEIARRAGFAEASSFSRAARGWFGESPRQFRARRRVASAVRPSATPQTV